MSQTIILFSKGNVMYFLDKYGWPIECVKGRWFFNLCRRLIHTRKIRRHWSHSPTEISTNCCSQSSE